MKPMQRDRFKIGSIVVPWKLCQPVYRLGFHHLPALRRFLDPTSTTGVASFRFIDALEMPPRGIFNWQHGFGRTQLVCQAHIHGRLADKGDRTVGQTLAVGAKHWTIMNRLWRWNRGVRVAHGGCGDGSADQHHVGFHTKKGWRPKDQIGPLAQLDRTNMFGDALSDCRVDCIFGDVALDPFIINCRLVPSRAHRVVFSFCLRFARCG